MVVRCAAVWCWTVRPGPRPQSSMNSLSVVSLCVDLAGRSCYSVCMGSVWASTSVGHVACLHGSHGVPTSAELCCQGQACVRGVMDRGPWSWIPARSCDVLVACGPLLLCAVAMHARFTAWDATGLTTSCSEGQHAVD